MNYSELLLTAISKANESSQETLSFFSEHLPHNQQLLHFTIQTLSSDSIPLSVSMNLVSQIAQVVHEELSPFLLHLVNLFLKRLKDISANQLAESLAVITQNFLIGYIVVASSKSKSFVWDFINSQFQSLYQHIALQPQNSLILTRIIQFLPVELLESVSSSIMSQVLAFLKQKGKGKAQLLESVVAIILSVENKARYIINDSYKVKFSEYTDQIVPLLPSFLTNVDSTVRKVSLDVLYTIAVLAPQNAIKDRRFLEIVNTLKSDKVYYQFDIDEQVKQIRESASQVYPILADLFEQQMQQQVTSQRTKSHASTSCKKWAPVKGGRQQQQSTPVKQQPTVDLESRLEMAMKIIDQLVVGLAKKNILDENEQKSLQWQIDMVRDLTGDDTSINRNLEEKFSSEVKQDEEETFISKEAAEILREFKNRSQSIINTTRS